MASILWGVSWLLSNMNERQKELFGKIIEEYIRLAQPIASGHLQKKGGLSISAATIRNEMTKIEEEGYIYQPFTSAGRVPTEKGYRFYIKNFLRSQKPNKEFQKFLKRIKMEDKDSYEKLIKRVAKIISQASKGMVVVGFAPQDIYYTGIRNLFSQPEFVRQKLIFSLSEIIDHFDESVEKLFEIIDEFTDASFGPNKFFPRLKILIGRDNPISRQCSIIVMRYKVRELEGLFGILGPIRMDYNRNIALLRCVQNLI
ncbi:MAG: hypothetical protein COX43_01220 [Parcubacteria group bacterium CG23_combo_of_CG06-09_8_20_14_all_35_9]|nr:MAG: hypothetical protein COX43_01220 [Parcubacteria group bacterium CG23_combo_of_CG06-09_8_20_14_all_35_9]